MKAELIGSNNSMRYQGSSILEVLIAISVLTLGIAASTLLSFANQSVKLDSDTSGEALYKAKDTIENTRALSRQDFNSAISTATSSDGIYSKKLDVIDMTSCRKEAISRIIWSTEPTRLQKIKLTTDLTDIASTLALGGDCATDPPIGGWGNPASLVSRELKKDLSLGDNPSVNSDAGTPATDIDVLNKMIYMTAISSKDDFFILDGTSILNLTIPPILGSINISAGLNAVDTTYDSNTGKYYAYVANASTTSSVSSDEFLVIDVDTPSAPNLVKSISLGITPNCPIYCPGGAQAIYYYNGRVYIGTHRIGGPEFYVFSVSPPYSPTSPHLLGSFELDHNINSIVVRGDYAYLATSGNTKEVIILNVSTPASITEYGSFDAKNADGTANNVDGTRLFLLGNKLYLGREKVSKSRPEQRDFYVIDVSYPATPEERGSVNLQILTDKNFSTGIMVTGIYVIGKYAFVATDDSDPGFIVLDISTPSAIGLVSTFNYANNNTEVDFENGFIYTSNSQNNALRIIRPAECADKIDDDGDGLIDSADPQCHTDGNVNNLASYDPEDDKESP